MKTPERIYIHPGVHNYNSEIPFTGSVEYVRSDISESNRNEFAIFCYDAGKWGGERDAEKLYELFNSRKK